MAISWQSVEGADQTLSIPYNLLLLHDRARPLEYPSSAFGTAVLPNTGRHAPPSISRGKHLVSRCQLVILNVGGTPARLDETASGLERLCALRGDSCVLHRNMKLSRLDRASSELRLIILVAFHCVKPCVPFENRVPTHLVSTNLPSATYGGERSLQVHTKSALKARFSLSHISLIFLHFARLPPHSSR